MKNLTSKKIKLSNVRLSYPCLFQKSVFNGVSGKFSAVFLINKNDKANVKKIDDAIADLMHRSSEKVSLSKICKRDGDESDQDGYEGSWYIKASSKFRPSVFNSDRSEIDEVDNIIYAGCYVHAIITLWFQNNNYGKRINASLYGVQFAREGESLGGVVKCSADEFDDFDDFGNIEKVTFSKESSISKPSTSGLGSDIDPLS